MVTGAGTGTGRGVECVLTGAITLSSFSPRVLISERRISKESLQSQFLLTGESLPCWRSLIRPSCTTGSVKEELVMPDKGDGLVVIGGDDEGKETLSGDLLEFS